MIVPHLHALAARLVGARTFDAVFAPMLADLQVEWEAARVRGRWPALAVLAAGHWHFARTVAAVAMEDGHRRLRSMPWTLFVPALVTSLVGVSVLRDPRQAVYLGVAAILVIAAATMPRRWLVGGRSVLAAAGIGLVGLLLVRGISDGGSTRWISVAGLRVLPGELVRPLMLAALAAELETRSRLRFLAVAALIVTPVALQADPGTTLVLLVTVGSMAWAGSRSPGFSRLVAALCAIGAIAALASGVPAATEPDPAAPHTDLVLGLVQDRAGLAAAALLVGVALSTAWLVRSATRGLGDAFSRALAAGVCAATLAQTALHVGAACGVLPQLGLALPTVSYGGSSLVAHWASLGLVAGLVLHARQRGLGDPLAAGRPRGG